MDSRDFDALEGQAYARVSAGAAAFCACGADDEITVAENTAAWRTMRLRPHVLRGVTVADTATTLLGQSCAMPILVAPSGRHRLYHDEGECATARGAAAAGAGFVLATNATMSVEQVAAERRDAPHWFQLYLPPERGPVEALIDRLAAAGVSALMLTVDQPVGGWSPRAARAPIEASPDLRHVNLPGAPMARTAYDPALKGVVNYPNTLDDLEWLAVRAPMDVLVKGVLRADDAARCIDAGARAIVVSNHGGRHLDTAVPTAYALPEVVRRVGDRVEIYVDGGIRRGTDILKALALGARAVLIGRPALWGLAVHGAEGVHAVLAHLKAELAQAMVQCGCARLADISSDLVATNAAVHNPRATG